MTDADCVVDENWLKNLISRFSSKEIIATAGYCSTPKTVNTIQRLIGRELEDRFDNFPKFILRAPTMNLCVRTEVAKKVKFDERFDVAQETDWGYRLAKFGRMRYVPKAVVYHYHRPTLKGFFKQQFKYGRNMPLLYFKHMRMSTGDHISKPIMIFQEFIFIFACLFLILSFFNPNFFALAISLFAILFISYLLKSINLVKNIFEIPLFFFLFFFRTVAWTIGLVFGLFDLFLKRR
jgi:GT2 family glycosyltransferase